MGQSSRQRAACEVLSRLAMIARNRPNYVRLLSVLIAGAAAPSLAVACGGKSVDDGSSGSSGSSTSGGSSSSGSSGKGGSSGSSGTSGSSGSSGISTGCDPFTTILSTVDPAICQPQLKSRSTCGGAVCSWVVEVPCSASADPDAGEPDAGKQQPCVAICNAARPAGTQPITFCHSETPDGSATTTARCGACGVGRPPRGFLPQTAFAPSDAAQRLAQMAQLEAASVDAFHALHVDLVRLGAPRRLLRAVLSAAKDEVRHARAVKRAAERLGARVPEVVVPPARSRSLVELAVENAEEGCVRETFGAALAAMQSERAVDPRMRNMMRSIAKDELGHAALSWELAAWLDAQLDAGGRAAVARARRAAVQTLDEELAHEGAGCSLLGLPDATFARDALRTMATALATGVLARAA